MMIGFGGGVIVVCFIRSGTCNPRFASSFTSFFSLKPSNNTNTNTNTNNNNNPRLCDIINDRKLRFVVNVTLSETDIVNVVEQRIWHSMEEGHFENLPGKGKPLDLKSNPHADPAEDTLYRILSQNKCAPEWVELNKEITTNIAGWRLSLQRALAHKENGESNKWIECSAGLKAQIRGINDKVFRYNLIVPFGRQMCGLNWEREVARLTEKKADS